MSDYRVTTVLESWRGQILREFHPDVTGLTVVADPDGLFVEETVQREIHARGFEVLLFEDPMAFRFAYEAKYRFDADGARVLKLIVVVPGEAASLQQLPFDLLQGSRTLHFPLTTLFPNLSYPVVRSLDGDDLERLHCARMLHPTAPAGDNATTDFVLQHVFDVDVDGIRSAPDLLRVLLRRHYRNRQLPPLLDARFIAQLRAAAHFAQWPLATIVPDRKSFFAFLQQRWPYFVRVWLEQQGAGAKNSPRQPEPPEPAYLPFDDEDVRVYVDSLFLEGSLKPLDTDAELARSHPDLMASWMGLGLRTDEESYRRRRLERLMDLLQGDLPAEGARHADWLTFAPRWAELVVLWHAQALSAGAELRQKFDALRTVLDERFLGWCQSRYNGLHNLPASAPAMVHHIPKYLWGVLERSANPRGGKIALVVMDGLAWDQWLVLREVLQAQRPTWKFGEAATFAWVPTLTSISRQAIFAGKPPVYFGDSLTTTAKEPARWRQFWLDQGLTASEVAYAKVEGQTADLAAVEAALAHPKARILGMVVTMVDEMMHGMRRGTRGMHEQVRPWARDGFLAQLGDALFARGFQVFLTADHGNVQAEGCGRPTEGSLASQRGQRVRIFPDQVLRRQVTARFPGAIEWPPVGLPEDCLPLLAPHRAAFITSGETTVSHGGLSLEELIVPLIHIEP